MTTTACVRDLGELIAILPFTFGFELSGCLVGVGLERGRVGPMQRVDLPLDPEHVMPSEQAGVCLRNLRSGADTVLVIVFEQVPGQGRALVRQYLDLCDAAGLPLAALGVVRDGHWWMVDADTGSVEAARPVPRRSDVPASFAFVSCGVAPLAGRESLVELLRVHPSESAAVTRELRRQRRHARPGRDAPHAWAVVLAPHRIGLSDDVALNPHVVAAAAHALQDVQWRDSLLSWLAPGLFAVHDIDPVSVRRVVAALGPSWAPAGPRQASALAESTVSGQAGGSSHLGDRGMTRALHVQGRLLRLLTALPSGERAQTATLLAAYLWARGDGAFASCAVQHALEDQPDYVLARLLLALIENGVTARDAAQRPQVGGDRKACG